MKVIQEKPKKEFIPITIIVESEEEAMAIWGRFNIAPFKAKEANARDNVGKAIMEQGECLYNSFSKVFKPD
jgi:hypothetical protein